jgi:putative membrane protein
MEDHFEHMMNQFMSSLLFSFLGLIVFAIAFWLIVKIAPFSVRQEIEKDQNVALGVVIAAVIIGIAMIISAAIHG